LKKDINEELGGRGGGKSREKNKEGRKGERRTPPYEPEGGICSCELRKI